MAKSKFSDKLKTMTSSWSESQNQYDTMFGGVKIDPGEYIAKVQMAKLTESKSSGKLMIRREHLIVEGSWKGTVVYDNMMLETPMGMTFVRRWFEMMGYSAPEDPAEIEDVIEAIAEEAATVKIVVKHSGDFINVAVIEVIESDDDEKQEAKSRPSAAKSRQDVKQEEPEQEAEAEEKDDDNADLRDALFAFCKAQDIDTEKDDDAEILCERIKEYKWPEEELTEDEKALFDAAEIADAIKRKEAPKKTRIKREKK